jgi:hypothetical protein
VPDVALRALVPATQEAETGSMSKVMKLCPKKLFFFFFFAVLEFELRAYTLSLHQPFFMMGFFQDSVL